MSDLKNFSLEELDTLNRNYLYINRETAIELPEVLNHQYIDYSFKKVHELIKRLQEFIK